VSERLVLLEAAFPAEPVLDIALSHALLADVAARRRPSALRVFRPGPTVAFGRLDALSGGFGEAVAIARAAGYTPVLRSVGGHAAVFDDRCVVVEHITYEDDATAGLQERFERQAELVRSVLAGLGADARIGALPGEYCPGEHSVNAGGRVKLAGIAQRVIRHGALASAVVVVSGGPDLRALVGALYAALGEPVDPATAGALDEELPGARIEPVARALVEAYGAAERLERCGPDDDLVAAAHALEPRHSLP
jgi:lipoate-protein ligase A